MSNTKLKAATKYIVARATEKKKTKKKQKDSQSRADAEKFPGQMFVLNKEHQAALIYREFGIRLSKAERNEMFALIDAFMHMKEAKLRIPADRKADLEKIRNQFKEKPGDHVYIVSNFESAKTSKFKTKNPDDASKIQANYVNSLQRLNKEVTGSEISALSQVGHGDRGLSASQFGVDRAIQEAKDKFDLSDSEIAQLKTIVSTQRAKHKMKINFSHDQIYTSTGKFQKNFAFVLSSQDTLKNEQDRRIEVAAFTDTLKEMNLFNLETSTLIDKALGQVTLEALAGKKQPNKKVIGKRKKKIKESAKGDINFTRNEIENVAYQATRGISVKGIKQRKAKQKSLASSPLRLIGLINKSLPEVVRKNMRAPGLVNQTGAFADSVEITDITQTRQGFPSIGYKYAKNPYQVFEMGAGSAPWATPERDPRRLIDRSIREIAAQFALGRFYTRRV